MLSICFEREHALASAGLRLNHFLRGSDGDGLGLLAHFEIDVQAASVVGTQANGLLGMHFEPGQLDLHRVGSREHNKLVLASVVRDGDGGRLRAAVRQGDSRAGEHTAAAVLDHATEGGGGR